jgi:hypothetical protein
MPDFMGVSLYTPRMVETAKERFKVDLPADMERITGYRYTPFLDQVPCSWGALYSPTVWKEFRNYLRMRLEQGDSVKMNIPNSRINGWKGSWKKYLMEMTYSQGLYMLYPNFKDQVLPRNRSKREENDGKRLDCLFLVDCVGGMCRSRSQQTTSSPANTFGSPLRRPPICPKTSQSRSWSPTQSSSSSQTEGCPTWSTCLATTSYMTWYTSRHAASGSCCQPSGGTEDWRKRGQASNSSADTSNNACLWMQRAQPVSRTKIAEAHPSTETSKSTNIKQHQHEHREVGTPTGSITALDHQACEHRISLDNSHERAINQLPSSST